MLYPAASTCVQRDEQKASAKDPGADHFVGQQRSAGVPASVIDLALTVLVVAPFLLDHVLDQAGDGHPSARVEQDMVIGTDCGQAQPWSACETKGRDGN